MPDPNHYEDFPVFECACYGLSLVFLFLGIFIAHELKLSCCHFVFENGTLQPLILYIITGFCLFANDFWHIDLRSTAVKCCRNNPPPPPPEVQLKLNKENVIQVRENPIGCESLPIFWVAVAINVVLFLLKLPLVLNQTEEIVSLILVRVFMGTATSFLLLYLENSIRFWRSLLRLCFPPLQKLPLLGVAAAQSANQPNWAAILDYFDVQFLRSVKVFMQVKLFCAAFVLFIGVFAFFSSYDLLFKEDTTDRHRCYMDETVAMNINVALAFYSNTVLIGYQLARQIDEFNRCVDQLEAFHHVNSGLMVTINGWRPPGELVDGHMLALMFSFVFLWPKLGCASFPSSGGFCGYICS
jgi:hypothetical protein